MNRETPPDAAAAAVGARFAVEAVRVGASRAPGTLAFTGRRLAALAAHHHVLVLDPAADSVQACLGGHTDRVVGVCWLQPPLALDAEADELVSCSVDGSVRVWSLGRAAPHGDTLGRAWRCASVLDGHAGPVLAVAAHALPGGAALVVSAGLDCTLRGWLRHGAGGSWAPLAPHVLRPTSRMHALAVTTLPGVVAAATEPGSLGAASVGALVAAGGVDGRVHLFTVLTDHPGAGGTVGGPAAANPVGGGGSGFVELLSLAGHLDWVRCLAFSHHSRIAAAAAAAATAAAAAAAAVACSVQSPVVPASWPAAEDGAGPGERRRQEQHVMLASGSNDGKVRLWRLSLAAAAAATAAAASMAAAAAEGSDSSCAAATTRAAGVTSHDAHGCIDEGDEADDNGEAPSAAAGDAAFDSGVQERGSLLAAASFLQHHAALVARCDPRALAGGGPAQAAVTAAAESDAHSTAAAAGAVSSLATLQRPKAFSVRVGASALGGAGAPRASSAAEATAVTLTYEATCDALLSGHDGWVTSVGWRAPLRVAAVGQISAGGDAGQGGAWWQPPCLVTASMDRTIALWQPSGATGSVLPAALSEQQQQPQQQRCELQEAMAFASEEARAWAGVWEPSRRIGGAGGVGGLMGLYSGCLSPDGSCLLAHSHNGAVHAWLDTAPRAAPAAGATPLASKRAAIAAVFKQQWKPAPSPTGHFEAVTDIVWGTAGAYAVSTSDDATTRVWAPYAAIIGGDGGDGDRQAAGDASPDSPHSRQQQRRWCELGRPQIHGYAMAAVAVPPTPRLPHRLFSCGDEKVARVFDAPQQFLAALSAVSGRLLEAEGRLAVLAPSAARDADDAGATAVSGGPPHDCEDSLAAHRAAFAYVSELALTNKGIASDSAAGTRIADRFQLDGRDAVAPPPTASAAVDPHASTGLPPVSSADPATAPYLPPPRSLPASVSSTQPSSAPPSDTAAQGGPPAAAPSQGPLASPGPSPPPLEDDLVTHTRWPETDKLFGHPHEVVCVAASGCGRLAATSCKARSAGDAAILLWDTRTCRRHQVLLAGHKLTPVSLAWSHPAGAVVPVPPHVRGFEALRLQCTGATSPSLPQLFWAPEPSPTAAAAAAAAVVAASPAADCDFLVSVGKDRQVALFARVLNRAREEGMCGVGVGGGAGDGVPSHSSAAALPPALAAAYRPPPTYRHLASFTGHKRIIWAVSWAPLPVTRSLLLPPPLRTPPLPPAPLGGRVDTGVGAPPAAAAASPAAAALPPCALFATGSRDHTCKLWLVTRRPASGVGSAVALSTPAPPPARGGGGRGARGDGAGDAGGDGPAELLRLEALALGEEAGKEEEVAAAFVARGADALDKGEAATRGGSGGGGGGGHATHHRRGVAPHGSDDETSPRPRAGVVPHSNVDGGGDDEDGGVLTLSAACTLPQFESPVTALAFAPVSAVAMAEVFPSPSPGSEAGGAAPESAPRDAAPLAAAGAVATVWLAVGLESGAVSLWRVSGGVGHGNARGWAWAAAPAGSVPPAVGHAGAVRKLAWRPPVAPPHLSSPRGGGGGDHAHVDLLLASAGDDHTVRFTRVAL